MANPAKIILAESQLPRQWFNVVPDLPLPPPPPLHPGTLHPVGHLRQNRGMMPAAGPAYALAAAIEEAKRCAQTGEDKVILTALCGRARPLRHVRVPAIPAR